MWSTLTATFATEKFHLTKLRTKFVTKSAHAGKINNPAQAGFATPIGTALRD